MCDSCHGKNFEHTCYSCDASMCSECFSLHNCAEEGEEEEQEEADEEEEEAEDDATFVTRDSFRGDDDEPAAKKD